MIEAVNQISFDIVIGFFRVKRAKILKSLLAKLSTTVNVKNVKDNGAILKIKKVLNVIIVDINI